MEKENIRIFLSYARGDDQVFVRKLYEDLEQAGFSVWFDRESLMSRGLSFHQEIKDAIRAEVERVVYIGGPNAAQSAYVREEWQFALECDQVVVTPILRLGDYETCIPGELGLLHCEDFRDDSLYTSALAKLIAYLRQPSPKLGALYAVPNLPPHFLGRPGLMARVRDALLVDLQKPQIITSADAKVGMQGMGGIGKSVLAAALARNREVRQSYPDGVIWISCGQKLTREDLLARLRDVAKNLGGDTDFESIPQGQGMLRELFQAKSVLLVLDDVWQSSDAQIFDVVGPRCRMLVTTRDAGILHALHGELVPVSLFTEPEALQLLADAVGWERSVLPPEALEVVRECGCLPLAVALSGGMAKKRGGDFHNVLERLHRADLDKIADRASINEQHQSIWRAMHCSVEVLAKEEQSRFAELSVFATDRPVPEAAIATLWSHTGHLDDLDIEDLLINLSERSLVQLDEIRGTNGQIHRRFSLHDLLHDYAVRIADEPKTLHHKLVEAYRGRCCDGWHTGPNDGYFLENLCHHLVSQEDWATLIGDEEQPGVLTDLRFIETKCAAGMIYDLVRDYSSLLAILPEFLDEVDYMRNYGEAMFSYNHALRRYAVKRYEWLRKKERGEIRSEPEYPELPRILVEEEPPISPKKSSSRAERLLYFSDFVSNYTADIRAYPSEIISVAINSSECGPVARSAERQLENCDRPYLHRAPRQSPPSVHSQCLRIIEGHTHFVQAMSVCPDSQCVVSGSWDRSLRVWNLETGECLRILKGHEGSVNCVSVSPDGRRVVSGSDDETLRVWDLETGECLSILNNHNSSVKSVSISPDGRRAVSGGSNSMIVRPGSQDVTVGRSDATLRVWNLETGECMNIMDAQSDGVYGLTISPDGHKIVSTGKNGTILVWDLATGQCLYTLRGHTSAVYSVAVSPDGRRIISGGGDENVIVWDLETGECMNILKGHTNTVFNVSVSPDGRKIISSGSDRTIRLWDIESGACLQMLSGHTDDVWSAQMIPNGRIVISASHDTTLRVWNSFSNQNLRELDSHMRQVTCVSLSPNAHCVVTSSRDSTLRLWDLKTGKCSLSMQGHKLTVNSVIIAPNGHFAVSGSDDRTLRVWDLERGECIQILNGHAYPVNSVSVSPDGKRAVSADCEFANMGHTIRIWDLDSFQCIRIIDTHASACYGVSVSPDGCFILSISSVWVEGENTLNVWDLKSGDHLKTLVGHVESIYSVCLSPDGRLAVSGGADNTLRVWNLKKGECVNILKGHTGSVSNVKISPDGQYVISGSYDQSLRIWDIRSGHCIAVHPVCDPVTATSTLSHCGRIVCGTTYGQLHFLTSVNFPPSAPAVATAIDPTKACCPYCAIDFPPVREVTAAIRFHTDTLRPGQSPCLDLPDPAFNDPRLQTACPHCTKPLKFNPFFVERAHWDIQ